MSDGRKSEKVWYLDMDREIAVIGGGAAGMMAAVQAAYRGAHVTVYEQNDRIGKKILSTGNGKCNFSNMSMSAACYYGGGAFWVDGVYERFGVAETRLFFEKLGMRIKEKNGYLYPASEQAATVSDVLRYEMARLEIRLATGCRVTGIAVYGGLRRRLSVETEDKIRKAMAYDAVILACGGKAAPKTGSDGSGFEIARRLGHRIVPTVPALVALRCEGTYWKQVAGVRCEAGLALYIAKKQVYTVQGELQLTDYGVSGIPVFQFSRIASYALREGRQVTVEIDFMPVHVSDGGISLDLAQEERAAFWRRRWKTQQEQTMEQFVTGIVNKKIGMLLLKLAGIRETERAQDIQCSRRAKLEALFQSFQVVVKGTNSFEQAQVCAGGVDFQEVSQSLESRKVSGVFFAGEMLDIDGICGGYNLQWAWSSGALAGRAAAES